MLGNLDTLITDAVALKQQMNAHLRTLYQSLDQPAAFRQEQRDAGKVLTHQYAPAIREIVKATTLADLTQRRDKLDRWLNKGWAHCHLHPEDREAYDIWEAGLVEYTVICDAIEHTQVINGNSDRIGWIEQFVRPLEQRSLV